jgi:hypothetical protein
LCILSDLYGDCRHPQDVIQNPIWDVRMIGYAPGAVQRSRNVPAIYELGFKGLCGKILCSYVPSISEHRRSSPSAHKFQPWNTSSHKRLRVLGGIKPILFDAPITILPSELRNSLFSLGRMFRRPNFSRRSCYARAHHVLRLSCESDWGRCCRAR